MQAAFFLSHLRGQEPLSFPSRARKRRSFPWRPRKKHAHGGVAGRFYPATAAQRRAFAFDLKGAPGGGWGAGCEHRSARREAAEARAQQTARAGRGRFNAVARSATAPGPGVWGATRPASRSDAACRTRSRQGAPDITSNYAKCAGLAACGQRILHNWMLCYTAIPFTPCLHNPGLCAG